MTTARVALFTGDPGRIELREAAVPRPGPGEALVRVLGCTLCASDLHTFTGRRAVAVPTILGHEIVGEIVAAGDDAFAERVGERVTWAIVAACGGCFACDRGLPQKCLRGVKYGHERFATGREWYGGLAEYVLLAPGTRVFPVPESLPVGVAAAASCATATAAAAIAAAGPLRDRSVCVLGAGALGLTAAAMAAAAGARQVVCVEPREERRARATAFGATHAVAADGLAALRAAAGPEHGFDAAIEMAGSNAAFTAAWPHVRAGGTIVIVGAVFPADPVGIALEQVVRRNLTITGVHNYRPEHLEAALGFLAREQGRFPFATLVGEWFPLDRVADAFAAADRPGAIRVGVGG